MATTVTTTPSTPVAPGLPKQITQSVKNQWTQYPAYYRWERRNQGKNPIEDLPGEILDIIEGIDINSALGDWKIGELLLDKYLFENGIVVVPDGDGTGTTA